VNTFKSTPRKDQSLCKRCTFLVDLEASEEQLCDGGNFLLKDFPIYINFNLVGEIKELPCFYQAKLFR
jgi:hypothetical protein